MGFISLALLLFFAGAVSVSELNRLRSKTTEIIETSTRNTDLAKRMLNAVQVQNSAIIEMISFGRQKPNSSFDDGVTEFNQALLDATVTVTDRNDLDSIYMANDTFHEVIDHHLQDNETDTDWFINNYINAYYALDSAIKGYMTSPQSILSSRTELFEKNAYRTITPSILTLCIAILIVLMFYFFMDYYYVKPILNINKALTKYIEYKIPFDVNYEGSKNSEIAMLKQNIEKLTGAPKNKPQV